MLNCRLPRYSNIDFYEKGPHIFFLLGPSVRIIIRSECIIDTRNLAVKRVMPKICDSYMATFRPQQLQRPQWPLEPHFTKKFTELDIFINSDTKMTYPGLLMWDGSSKIYCLIDFWYPFSWRLWRAHNIKKIKTVELGINEYISWTCMTQNISKNQNL